MNLEPARLGVQLALATAMRVVERGQRLSSYVLPPRYGKSDLIRLLSVWLLREGNVAVNIVVTPWLPLVEQFMKADDWREACERYDMDLRWFKMFRHTAGTDNPLALRENGEHLLAMSTALFCKLSQSGVMRDFIDHIAHTTSKRVAIHIDEGHTHGSGLQWGRASLQAAEAGAFVFYFTGTPYRDDGDLIPGFEFETTKEEPITIVTTEAVAGEPYLVRVNIEEGVKREKRMVADFEHTLEQAWDEGHILGNSHETIDVDLSLVAGEAESRRRLSELSANEVRGKLTRLVRAPVVVSLAAEALVRRLADMRTRNGRATAIVYCGNDQPDDDGANFHARKIAKEIVRLDPRLRVGVATMKSEEDAGDMIARYRDHHAYDVLIVKQMGGVGLDAAHCKVVLDLSSVRTRAQCMQRWGRGATLWEPFKHYVLITLADVLSRALYADMIAGKGGSVSIEDLETVKTYEQEKGDPKDRVVIDINAAMRGDFRDSNKNEALSHLWPLVSKLYERFEVLIGVVTPADLANAIAEGLPGQYGGPQDVSKEAADMRAEINACMKDLATRRRASGTYAPDDFGELMSDNFVMLYRACGVRPGIHLDEIHDLGLLSRLKREATIMLETYR